MPGHAPASDNRSGIYWMKDDRDAEFLSFAEKWPELFGVGILVAHGGVANRSLKAQLANRPIPTQPPPGLALAWARSPNRETCPGISLADAQRRCCTNYRPLRQARARRRNKRNRCSAPILACRYWPSPCPLCEPRVCCRTSAVSD